ncbi:MAG TPA: N-acetylmuramoyl-L-alanine amidase [Flavitalea sp.]|nr:N-acetylmuramoyl-L-alanine amidase [Flavitalea sp.]
MNYFEPDYQPMRYKNLFILFLSLVTACANPYRVTNREHKKMVKEFAKQLRQKPVQDSLYGPKYWAGTINFNLRKPSYVIIHHTAQESCDQTLRTFTMKQTQVSAHYVICKDGIIHHMLNDYFRAWHGGLSRWGNLTDLNSASIGIELDNNGTEPFPDVQMNSLMHLLDTLKNKYQIPQDNFLGHSDIAPRRKVDPNVLFPWKILSDKGFGMWYDDTTGIEVPPGFNAMAGLRMIGYSVQDTAAAIGSFKRHFIQDTIPQLNGQDLKILYRLAEKMSRN